MLGHLGPMLCPCWTYIGPMVGHVGPCWDYVGPMLGQVGPILGLCWASVGPMLGHVEPKFGIFADFRSLKKIGKHRILEQ